MKKYSSYITTYSGIKFGFVDIDKSLIYIGDIAHALSNICRFGGHTKEFYSVAEHSVLVSRNVSKEAAIYGLMHDAGEAYLMDIPRPIKQFAPKLERLEQKLLNAIVEKYNIPINKKIIEEVKDADNRILEAEGAVVFQQTPTWWNSEGIDPRNANGELVLSVKCLPPKDAKELFLIRFFGIVPRWQTK